MPATQPCALITGAGTGIGRATAQLFLQKGYRVIAVGRRLPMLQAIDPANPGLLAFSCDLSQALEIEELAKSILQNKDLAENLQVLVNNAGQFERKSVGESDEKTWTRILQVNLIGPALLTRALWTSLAANRAAIINVSSTLGLRPIPDTSVYSASKAAMINWTNSLALEGAKHGLRACVVCPGIVDTPIQAFHQQSPEEKNKLGSLQPLGRVGKPEDVAHAIWSLAAPEAGWFTGTVLKVDGGIELL